ncbi:GTP-binding protein [Clostridiales bacterium]|nr:GTP-binding protein [Clostridiales bacterium]
MEDTSKRKKLAETPLKHINIALLAHVDAGKTTLSEALLYTAGTIRKLGRVDHGNAFLDTDAQERARGITIFSKQAQLRYQDMEIMLLDTPGHVDFSAEMERTLQVLDYGVLVISGKDGVQGHTGTLWKLLKKYEIPTFIFFNKMDLEGTDRRALMEELKQALDEGCVDFSAEEGFTEQAAMCDEALLEEYLETDELKQEEIIRCVKERKLFPCYFGSALKLEGIEAFLQGLLDFTQEPSYPDEFGARVYKITRDSQGNRLTHMKITGGVLKVKDFLTKEKDGEKADQLRIYSGDKFKTQEAVAAGRVCAVKGPEQTYAGQALGCETAQWEAVLEPVLTYQVVLSEGTDPHAAFLKLKQLEEEDPQLHMVWDQQLKEIQLQLMGEVQLEILTNMINERFGFSVTFGTGRISYKETIEEPVVGAGHFEPLRHYAEVHLLLEPGARGSGMTLDTVCSEDVLERNWQRLILTHLAEKEHLGALTGSPVTDIKITLLTGRAHLKHTEGGDFRQATYRAVRQGLRKAKPVLLEPWYEFQLEVPSDLVGRAMSDIQRMGGSFETPQTVGDGSLLQGKAPVSEMKDYTIDVASYTKGRGRLSLVVSGYEPCHAPERVAAAIDYDPDRDVENTADSVFCQHGAGFNVKWDQVEDYLHLDSGWQLDPRPGEASALKETSAVVSVLSSGHGGASLEDQELERIFQRTYGADKQKKAIPGKTIEAEKKRISVQPAEALPEYLLVDGYNIIFAWDELKALAKVSLDAAREALIEILSNYQGYRKCRIIAVFDAYKVKGGERRFETHDNIDVVYTKEAETADTYIEKATYEMAKKYYVRVATSDNLEQMIILGNGAFKVSAQEFQAEVERANAEITAFLAEYNRKSSMESRNRIQIPEKKQP